MRFAFVPQPTRERLRRVRDHLQQLDSALRRQLPERYGGRFSPATLLARRLADQDYPVWLRLRPVLQLEAAEPLCARDRVWVGIFAHGRLLATGLCLARGDTAEPFRQTLFASDFVHPRYRRRGLAQTLHAARLALLETMGTSCVYAWIDPNNGAAVAALRAQHFREASATLLPDRPSPQHRLLSRQLQPRAAGKAHDS
jgi:GNAT superfamily N-acetyltransferase